MNDSYFNGTEDYNYTFFLYPDFLVMEYEPHDPLDNKTYRNILGHFHSVAMAIDRFLLEKLGIKSNREYKLIIFCYSCETDARDVNMEMYKIFFRMTQYVKKSGLDPTHFILYDTPNWQDKEHDLTVVSFPPENGLFSVLELKEIIIPYSNKKIEHLLEEIDNSRLKLKDISKRLADSKSKEDTEKLIEDLNKIEDESPYYHEELSKFRILKNKEVNFILEKTNYFQIISKTNKTYERIIKEHASTLEGNIILLESKVNFWDSQYWHLKDSSMAKLAYQQQKSNLLWTLFVMFLIFVSSILADLYLTKRQVIGKIEELTNKQIKSTEERDEKQITKLSDIDSALNKIKDQLELEIQSTKEEDKKKIAKLGNIRSTLNEIKDLLVRERNRKKK